MKADTLPPGPRGLPLLGNAIPVLTDFLGLLDELRACGDVAYFSVFNHRVYLVNRPGFIEEVLVSQRQKFLKGPAIKYARRVLGEGLIALDGEKHHRHRVILQPAFHRKAVADYARDMVAEAQALAAAWRPGAAVDMYAEMRGVSLRIALRSLLGIRDGAEAGWMSRDFDFFLTEFSPRRFLFPRISALCERLPTGKTKRLREAKQRIDETIARLIESHRREPGEGIIGGMAAKDAATGEPVMTDEEIRDEVVTLLGAGHATTSLGMTYAWHFLGTHPEARRKLGEELARELGGRAPGLDDIPRLNYLKMVLKETLRLMPPIFFIGLIAAADHEFGRHRVPAGSVVAVSQYVTHRDGRYFPEPLLFQPERWADEAAARDKFSYFPFGGGPRGCIGEGFAWAEMMLVLATLARRWNPKALGGALKIQPSITLHLPKGLPMRVERS